MSLITLWKALEDHWFHYPQSVTRLVIRGTWELLC